MKQHLIVLFVVYLIMLATGAEPACKQVTFVVDTCMGDTCVSKTPPCVEAVQPPLVDPPAPVDNGTCINIDRVTSPSYVGTVQSVGTVENMTQAADPQVRELLCEIYRRFEGPTWSVPEVCK